MRRVIEFQSSRFDDNYGPGAFIAMMELVTHAMKESVQLVEEQYPASNLPLRLEVYDTFASMLVSLIASHVKDRARFLEEFAARIVHVPDLPAGFLQLIESAGAKTDPRH